MDHTEGPGCAHFVRPECLSAHLPLGLSVSCGSKLPQHVRCCSGLALRKPTALTSGRKVRGLGNIAEPAATVARWRPEALSPL